jgi:hypothetical protein
MTVIDTFSFFFFSTRAKLNFDSIDPWLNFYFDVNSNNIM